MRNGRDIKGRFASGNKCGKGRPRRAVERDYLAKLSDNITPYHFGLIVQKAVQDAIDGDYRAREFVTKHVLGDNPGTLHNLAAKEAVGVTVKHELVNEAHLHRADHLQAMGLRQKTAPPDALASAYPIEVGELEGEPSLASGNGKPTQQFKNGAKHVI